MDESRIADPSSALRRSDRSLPTRLSRAVSVVLHPLVMPLYVILLLVAGPTQLSYFPASVKFYLLWVTVLYTAVIPLLSVGLLRSVGRISSLAIDDRRERILPLAIGIVCYLLCAATVARIPSAMIVRKFMLAGACCELFCLAVTFYWKISLHLAAQGAAAALLVLLTFGNAGNLTGALAVAVLAALAAFGIGNMSQVNSIVGSINNAVDAFIPAAAAERGMLNLILGIVLAVLVGIILFGGIKRIGAVAEKLVPAMALLYIVFGVTVIVVHANNIIPAFGKIFSTAFNPQAIGGATAGIVLKGSSPLGVLQRSRPRLRCNRTLCG